MENSTYSFCTSSQLHFPIHIKIGGIKGNLSEIFNNIDYLKNKNENIKE